MRTAKAFSLVPSVKGPAVESERYWESGKRPETSPPKDAPTTRAKIIVHNLDNESGGGPGQAIAMYDTVEMVGDGGYVGTQKKEMNKHFKESLS